MGGKVVDLRPVQQQLLLDNYNLIPTTKIITIITCILAGADTVLITRATEHLVLSYSFRINPNPCYPAHVRQATTLSADGLANSPWNEFQNQSTYTSP